MKYRLGFLLIALFAALLCRAEQFGDVSIENVPPMITPGDGSGYFVREFRLENSGSKTAQIWMRLRGTSGMPRSVERSLLLPPGTVRNLQLYWPCAVSADRNYYDRYTGVQLDLVIDGRGVRHTLVPEGASIGIGRGRGNTALASGSVPVDRYRSFFDGDGRRGYRSTSVESSAVPAAQWGKYARDYSGLHSIWITPSDRIPPEVNAEIMKWVFSGGTLVVCVSPDEPWPEGKEPAGGGLLETRHGWGRRVVCRPIPPGGLKKIEKKAKAEEKKTEDPGTPFGGGNEDEGPKYEGTPGLELLKELAEGREGRRLGNAGNFTGNLGLEIPTIPLHLLFFVMLAFVILIGPVNYFVLKRFRRENLLLATTPAISLVFCLLVVGFITIDEGWYSRAKAYGITLLDQESRMAATQARVAVYAPVPPFAGFTFSPEEILSFYGAGTLQMDIDKAQHFGAGLLQPRIPLSCSVERTGPQREHLKVIREKDGVAVVNGLGAELLSVGVVDMDGRLFLMDEAVAPGARALLKPTSFRVGPKEMDWEQIFGRFRNSAGPEENFIRRNIRNFAPGYYVAIAKEPLFYTPGFRPDRFEAHHLIFGKYSFSGEE
ncbi:MAG: hypothetical protein HPZ91_09315 [Lentisphaeria bacterium]|nr:hypothetical protein [Lentisphaeria bacterium]